MAKIIDLESYKINKTSSNIDRLALLSVFFFKDQYGEELIGLEDEVRYALAIMVYKSLKSYENDGRLVINDKGFLLDTDAKKELKNSIQSAIETQNTTIN